jgi:hypothetical protein
LTAKYLARFAHDFRDGEMLRTVFLAFAAGRACRRRALRVREHLKLRKRHLVAIVKMIIVYEFDNLRYVYLDRTWQAVLASGAAMPDRIAIRLSDLIDGFKIGGAKRVWFRAIKNSDIVLDLSHVAHAA